MLIIASSPFNSNSSNPSALYSTNNNFTCIYNDGVSIPRKAKIRVHSCYLSTLPIITLDATNNTIGFRITEGVNVYAVVLNLTVGLYTPQQLASHITDVYSQFPRANPPYANLQMRCVFDNLTGCFSFIFFTVAGVLSFDILYHPTNSATNLLLSKLMGFGGKDQQTSINCFYNSQEVSITADNSVSYNNFSNILMLNVDNINIKNENSNSKVSLQFVDVIETSKPMGQTNSYINQYEKAFSYLNNDDEILLSSLNISIRNLDGTICSFLDTTKAVTIIFEVISENDDKRDLVRNSATNPFLKK